MLKKFYITTAIPYVNAPPHLGFGLEIIQADVIARYNRLLGKKVFFLTGTDENSLKNVQAALNEKISVKKLVNRNAKRFYELKKILNISFDDFIRTTERRHFLSAQKLWLACKEDIYKKTYEGLYCVGCEEFYKESELKDGLCPEHLKKPELIKEENYFFRLSRYTERLKEIISKNEIEIIPEKRKNEVLSFIEQGLEDICISRSSERARGWGIPVPGDKTQVIWVWFDALANYLSAIGYGENEKRFKKLWPADLHVIGKGILRFHAIYWPAMLLSAKLPLPKKIFVHGYLTIGGQKISKSLGNVISPKEVVEKYGRDAVRYFLLREIPPTEDGDFTYEKLEKRYECELALGLGNLVSRILGMIKKYSKNKVPKAKSFLLKKDAEICWKNLKKLMEKFQFSEALSNIWQFIAKVDKFIDEEKPWELFKNKKERLNEVLFSLLNSLYHIAWQIYPFLPDTSFKIAKALGIKELKSKNPTLAKISILKANQIIRKTAPLFPKIIH